MNATSLGARNAPPSFIIEACNVIEFVNSFGDSSICRSVTPECLRSIRLNMEDDEDNTQVSYKISL